MRVGGTDVEKERFFRILGEKGFRVVGHFNGATGVTGDGLVELVDTFGRYVIFAATSCAIAAMRKVYRKADEVSVAVELVVTMLMTVMSVGMVVQPRKDDGSAGRAAGGRAEGVLEESSVVGESIEAGGFKQGVSICPEVRTLVIGDEQDDIALCCLCCS